MTEMLRRQNWWTFLAKFLPVSLLCGSGRIIRNYLNSGGGGGHNRSENGRSAWVDWLWWGETDVSELQPLRANCSSPDDWDVDHSMMVSTGLTPGSSTRALWQPPVLSSSPDSRDISGASRRMGEGNENLVYSSPSILDYKRLWMNELVCNAVVHCIWVADFYTNTWRWPFKGRKIYCCFYDINYRASL
jgi:hypothetical protein